MELAVLDMGLLSGVRRQRRAGYGNWYALMRTGLQESIIALHVFRRLFLATLLAFLGSFFFGSFFFFCAQVCLGEISPLIGTQG